MTGLLLKRLSYFKNELGTGDLLLNYLSKTFIYFMLWLQLSC